MGRGKRERPEPKVPAREYERVCDQLDAVVAAVKALIGQARELEPEAMRHALVGLLPEVQPIDPAKLAGRPDLIERDRERVRAAWREYGYGD